MPPTVHAGMDYRLFPTLPELIRPSAELVNIARRVLENAWEFDEHFFPNLFPVTTHVRNVYTALEADLRRGGRWKRVPEKEPSAVSKLYLPLQGLMGDILRRFDIHEDARRVLNTSRRPIYPNISYPVRPSLLLVGCGKYFAGTSVKRPLPDYALAISPVEIVLEGQDETLARDRLAISVQQLFHYQINRRFAYGMVITQQTLTLYMLDRFGALFSPRLDYHAHPIQFCAIIAGLASADAARLGIDTTMFTDTRGHVTTREVLKNGRTRDVTYTLDTPLYYASDLGGRGTMCYLAYEKTAPDTHYVIKDSWVPVGELEGRESEPFLLAHARSKGVVKGIVQVRHSEEVQVKSRKGSGDDALLRHRQILWDRNRKDERIHTRIVLSPYGKPLSYFSSKRELLLAYHDAVQAHRELLEVGGILHRDIKPANILINPRGGEGGRGVLIDLDHAIRLDNNSPYSTKRNIGTYLFMSKNALEGKVAQTYLDDLESFFYVIVYIVLCFPGPGPPSPYIHSLIQSWTFPMSFMEKGGFLFEEFDTDIEPWYGRPFENLVRQLHSIFRTHRVQCFLAAGEKRPLPTLDRNHVYDQFLSHIRQAILEVAQESHEESDESGDDLDTWNKNPDGFGPAGVPHTVAAARPRRSRAKYGTTKVAL